jgi:hypothetical protein
MTHDEMIAVIQHHKNGGKVECRCKGDCVWIKENHLDARGFNFADFDYRAKPEPLVAWIIYNETAQNILTFCGKSQSPTELLLEYQRKFPDLQITLKKFVEVEE